MAGYFLDGTMPTVYGDKLSNLTRVPVDTNLLAGAYPQSGGIVPGTLPAPAASVAVTAFAGGGQASATQLTYGVNVVTVVATAADSVKLPPCFPGATVFIKNADGADSVTVFGFGTDTIDSVASATGNAQAAGKGKLYYGATGDAAGTAGNWVSLLGA